MDDSTFYILSLIGIVLSKVTDWAVSTPESRAAGKKHQEEIEKEYKDKKYPWEDDE